MIEEESDSFLGEISPAEDVAGPLKIVKELHVSSKGPFRILLGERMGKRVIVKTLKEDCKGDRQFLLMLRKEFEIGFSLSHPGIVRTLDYREVDKLGECLIEEFIDGKNLDKLLMETTLSADEVKSIIEQIILTVDYMHERQVVHGDLKLSNIIISDLDRKPVIIDFGYADSPSYETLKFFGGTASYIAPERLETSYKLDTRSDIWSLGEIINRIASTQKGSSRRKLEKLAIKCKLPVDDRIQNAKALLKQFKRNKRNSFRIVILISAVMVIMGFGTWGLWNLEILKREMPEPLKYEIPEVQDNPLNMRGKIKEEKVEKINGEEGLSIPPKTVITKNFEANKDFREMAFEFAERHIEATISDIKAKGLYKKAETIGEMWNSRYVYDNILKEIGEYVEGLNILSEEEKSQIKKETIIKAREILAQEERKLEETMSQNE